MKYKFEVFNLGQDGELSALTNWANDLAKTGWQIHSITHLGPPPGAAIMITMETYDDDDEAGLSSVGILPSVGDVFDNDSEPESELDPIENDFWHTVLADVDTE